MKVDKLTYFNVATIYSPLFVKKRLSPRALDITCIFEAIIVRIVIDIYI